MPHAAAAECSQFTCFTGTKVQILPQQDLSYNALELHLCLESLPFRITCDILVYVLDMNLSLPGVYSRSMCYVSSYCCVYVAAGQAAAAGQRTAVLGGVCKSVQV